jgi:hypothetical protein
MDQLSKMFSSNDFDIKWMKIGSKLNEFHWDEKCCFDKKHNIFHRRKLDSIIL